LGFAVCGSSIRQGVFAGPKSLDAPEPSACDPSKPGDCGTFNYLVFSQVLGSVAAQTARTCKYLNNMRIFRAVDTHARRQGETRSGFLARAALDAMRKPV
jgi:hypothetical protein